MVLPRFVAENSLYRATECYQPAIGAFDSGGVVVPATCSQNYTGPCINGVQTVCQKGSLPFKIPCHDVTPKCETTCGPCTEGSCGTYPICAPVAPTQTCTDCHGNQTTHAC